VEDIRSELSAVAHAWDRAMVSNDADAIGEFMADDWTIVGPDGRIGTKDDFLALIRDGTLSHDEMTSGDFSIRLYGETAVLLSRGYSGGQYHGHRFREHELSTNVFVKQDGHWQCVMTHLSTLGKNPGPA
jgi:ketosteroid isomerase-like protein